MHIKQSLFKKRQSRVRYKLRTSAKGHYRLSIFKSNRYIYGQLIDDENSITITSVSTKEKVFDDLKNKANKNAARKAGELIAKRAIEQKKGMNKTKNLRKIYLDRGGCMYHGKIKEFAEGARKGGLTF